MRTLTLSPMPSQVARLTLLVPSPVERPLLPMSASKRTQPAFPRLLLTPRQRTAQAVSLARSRVGRWRSGPAMAECSVEQLAFVWMLEPALPLPTMANGQLRPWPPPRALFP